MTTRCPSTPSRPTAQPRRFVRRSNLPRQTVYDVNNIGKLKVGKPSTIASMRLQPAALAHAVERGEEMMVGTPPIIDLSKLEGTARIAADALKQLQETQEHAIAAVAQAGGISSRCSNCRPGSGSCCASCSRSVENGSSRGASPDPMRCRNPDRVFVSSARSMILRTIFRKSAGLSSSNFTLPLVANCNKWRKAGAKLTLNPPVLPIR